MADEQRRRMPRTIGELRRQLRERGEPWEVTPRLRDEEPLPTPARGGLEPGEGPPETEGPEPFEGDLGELLRESPPANPFVRERWRDQELLSEDDPGPGGGTPGELDEVDEQAERSEREERE
jgi:hypothetical protein